MYFRKNHLFHVICRRNIYVMKYLNYVLIVIGAVVAMYAKVDEDQNQIILIVGIMFLMIGVYRVARIIPSKQNEGNKDNDESTD